MLRAGWKPLNSPTTGLKYSEPGDEGWFRFAMTSPNFGTPVGKRKLMQLRSNDPEMRREAAALFVGHVLEFLPPGAAITYTPSSTRRTSTSDPGSISSAVLSELSRHPQRPQIVEPIIRTAPVPSVAETRVRWRSRSGLFFRFSLENVGALPASRIGAARHHARHGGTEARQTVRWGYAFYEEAQTALISSGTAAGRTRAGSCARIAIRGQFAGRRSSVN